MGSRFVLVERLPGTFIDNHRSVQEKRQTSFGYESATVVISIIPGNPTMHHG